MPGAGSPVYLLHLNLPPSQHQGLGLHRRHQEAETQSQGDPCIFALQALSLKCPWSNLSSGFGSRIQMALPVY